MGLNLIFLIVTRAVSVLGLSRRCCVITSLSPYASGLALIRG
ncbi:MAG TPA: hypothetical protein VI365_24795 [Trebonia sp.]